MDGPADGTIRIAKWIGRQDNNVAEYIALLEALQCALELKATALHVFSDSEVVVRQMSGKYSCRSPQLYSLNWICRKQPGRSISRSLTFLASTIPRPIVSPVRPLAGNIANLGATARAATGHTPIAGAVSYHQ